MDMDGPDEHRTCYDLSLQHFGKAARSWKYVVSLTETLAAVFLVSEENVTHIYHGWRRLI